MPLQLGPSTRQRSYATVEKVGWCALIYAKLSISCLKTEGIWQVTAAGRRKHFYIVDLGASKVERISHLTNREEKSLESFSVSASPEQPLIAFLGARGHLPLVSLRSKQVVAQLKMSGSVKSATFTEDGINLIASGIARFSAFVSHRVQNFKNGFSSGAVLSCSEYTTFSKT